LLDDLTASDQSSSSDDDDSSGTDDSTVGDVTVSNYSDEDDTVRCHTTAQFITTQYDAIPLYSL
jgi:hypothetical protein